MIKTGYDPIAKKKYSNESLLKGIINHTNFSSIGVASYGALKVGSGSRAELARILGFSSSPSEAECAAAQKTITLNSYPNVRLTVHKNLVDEVQSIFDELKRNGVVLDPTYCGGYYYRPIKKSNGTYGDVLSVHSFGAAIDVNYNVNAYVGGGHPMDSGDNTPAGICRTYKSPIVQAFARHGWGWGGRYGDYMHFSKCNGC